MQWKVSDHPYLSQPLSNVPDDSDIEFKGWTGNVNFVVLITTCISTRMALNEIYSSLGISNWFNFKFIRWLHLLHFDLLILSYNFRLDMQRRSFEGILKQLVCPSFSIPHLCWSPCLSTLYVDRFQRVLINGQCPNLQPVLEGVPKDRFLNLCFINIC